MFDIFDILVPTLSSLVDGGVRHLETPFGTDDTPYFFVGDFRLGRIVVAREFFSNLPFWTGANDRGEWTVLLARDSANDAVGQDELWLRFCAALRTFLDAHPTWRITCESDCDQHDVAELILTPTEVIAKLDRCRTRDEYPIAFVASSSGG